MLALANYFSNLNIFLHSVNHIRQVHPDALTRDKNAPCIVCPKLFARMDHLKKHVWSHVNKISPGIPPHFIGPPGGGDLNRPRPKLERPENETPTDPSLYGQLRFKMDPEDFPDGVDWSTQTYFNCYLCGVEVDGFRDGVKHVRHAHPETLIGIKQKLKGFQRFYFLEKYFNFMKTKMAVVNCCS